VSERTKNFIDIIDGFDGLRYGIYVFGAFCAKREYITDLDYVVMDTVQDIDRTEKT